jgi:hypothetical protein
MGNRPGRPPLDPNDPSVRVTLKIPSRHYDALYARASGARTSVPEMIRRMLTFRLPKSEGEPQPR